MQESVALPEPVRLAGVRVHDVLLVARLTRPLKPLIGERVIVEVPDEFTLALTLAGLTVSVKSCTTNVTVTVWERVPLVPVTPTW